MKRACLVGFKTSAELPIELKFSELFDKQLIEFVSPPQGGTIQSVWPVLYARLKAFFAKASPNDQLLVLSPEWIFQLVQEITADLAHDTGLKIEAIAVSGKNKAVRALEHFFGARGQAHSIVSPTVERIFGANRNLLCVRSVEDVRFSIVLESTGLLRLGFQPEEVVIGSRADQRGLHEVIRKAASRYARLLYATVGTGTLPLSVAAGWEGRVHVDQFSADVVRAFYLFLLKRQKEFELEDARTTQERMIQAPFEIPGYDVSVRSQPLLEVTGDICYLAPVCPGKWRIAVGDVAGDGAGAGMLVAELIGFLKSCSVQSPQNILRAIHSSVRWSPDGSRYGTLFCADLNESSGVLTFCNAGHHAPLLRRSQGQIERVDHAFTDSGQPKRVRNPPIGISEVFEDSNLEVEYRESQVTLGEGDSIVFFTDGIIETKNQNGDEFGINGLETLMCQCSHLEPQSLADEILESVEEFSGGSLEDDATLVVLVRSNKCSMLTRRVSTRLRQMLTEFSEFFHPRPDLPRNILRSRCRSVREETSCGSTNSS